VVFRKSNWLDFFLDIDISKKYSRFIWCAVGPCYLDKDVAGYSDTRILDTRILDTGYSILDTGYSMLDTGYSMLDT